MSGKTKGAGKSRSKVDPITLSVIRRILETTQREMALSLEKPRDPLAGVAWGAAIFRERLSIYLVLAMALMFVGVFLSGYRRLPSQSR